MKLKRQRDLVVPPKIRLFISYVTATPLESIDGPLRSFIWDFDKGDFHHWIDLFNHFDSFFEKHIKSRKDLQDENFSESDPPFPKEAVLQILRVIRIILENCSNKHFYNSYEQHLSSLLASTDADVIEACLETLAAFLKKTIGSYVIRDSGLRSKLFTFAQGWGGKEEGLGLVRCATENGSDQIARDLGSTLHFEFYPVNDTTNEFPAAERSAQGLQIIHLPNVNTLQESDIELLSKLVRQYNVPRTLRFSLLTRLRFARAFSSLASRQQYTRIRLYAFIVLIQACSDTDNLTSFFNNEPEFINELVTLLSYEDAVLEKIRTLSLLSLIALCQVPSRHPTVLIAVTSGGHRGILSSLVQKAVDSVSNFSKSSVVFAEALLSFVTVLVSSSSGSSAMREAGFLPALLPLLKDTDPQHLHLVSIALHVVEAFMDISNPAAALFQDLGGLDDTISRLKVEVSHIENGTSIMCECTSSKLYSEQQPLYSEALVESHRRSLMKALLRVISLVTYAPGSTARIYGSEENLLPHSLCIILRRAKDFGGGVFSLAATLMSDLIQNDPACFPILEASGLPSAFLDAILVDDGVLCSAEAIACIPQCLEAVCLSNNGLRAVKDRNALRCFVKIFTSRMHLPVLTGDTTGAVSRSLDEFMRHSPSLRGPAVDMLIEILNIIAELGSGPKPALLSNGTPSCSTPVPMETEESFLPEYIRNATRLAGTILQNSETCRIFVEKKGAEAVLQLFMLPLIPLSVSLDQSISAAFKNFSHQHSVSLARAVCSSLRDHLKLTNEYLVSVGRTQLAQLEEEKRTNLLRCLSSLKGILSLSNSLLKVTTAVISVLGTADVDVLKDLGRAYREILWQISLCGDLNVEENPINEVDHESTNADVSTATGMGSDDDLNIPVVGYRNNPFFSLRNSSHPRRGAVRNFLTVLPSGEGLRFSTRRGVARLRGGRTGRHLGALHIDSEVSTNNVECEPSSSRDMKKKSPEVVVLEILNQLASTLRSFFVSLAKGFTSVNRRRIETGPLSSALKNMGSALAKVFLEALGFSGYPTSVGLDMSLSVKCHYLGKVVDDMMGLTYDSKRGTCHTAMVNNFYVSGTFKELLTTFEATSQLLWTLPPVPAFAPEESDGSKLSHNSWLFKTLMSYCCVLEYFVNSVVLLSSQAQLLVQPVTDGSSIALFPVPRDPEVFVRMLQSQVLDVILPVWNHPMFPNCNSKFIILIVSLLTHVYSGVGDVKINHNSVPGVITNRRLVAPPPDEATIATIVEMGFTRARAEEALRQVRTNSVEVAMEWLFTHPEDPVQENDELVQALALSLESSPEMSKVEITDKPEDGQLKVPSLDDTLAAITRLFQTSEALNYPLRNLLVTICNRNKGEDRARVISYLVEQLKLCPWEFTKESSALCMISNTLALLFAEDEKTREIAARDGIVTVAVDILTNFKSRNGTGNGLLVPKCITGLLLILDNLLQCRPKIPLPSENSEGNITFENIFGKSTGYLAEESGRVLIVACELMKQQVPVMGALLPLCARLTKTHALALQFLEIGGLAALLSIQDDTTVASAIIRHLIEDPKTLQTAMELEIRQTLTGNRHAGRVLVQEFLTTMAPVISRDPEVFMKAAAAVCQLESSGGRTVVLLSKQKEREKVKGHKKVPANLSLVIDQLLQILLRYPSPKSEEGFTSAMEIDEPMTKVKGKSKVGETRKTVKSDNNTSEKPAGLAANVTFVLKLLSDILLMYVHVVGVILKRDLELYQVRGFGILHHVMHRLIPLSTAGPDEWTVELSEKASLFLVVLCGRSSEGRTRVISELVKALSSLSNLQINSSKSSLLPNKKVLSFVDLVYSILSKNPSSSNLPGAGYSPDVAKSMIDGGIVQCLSDILQVIDLDHPDAPKVVNLILKALETLTRAANASEQLVKPETLNKEKLVGPGDDQVNATSVTQTIDPDHNRGQDLVNDAAGTDQQPEGTTAHHESGLNSTNPNQSSDQDMGIEAEDMVLMHDEIEDDGVTRNADPIEMTFHVENSGDVDMGEEEDEEEEEDVVNDGGALMSLADTDVEDHFGLGDDYNEDEDEDEDDAEDDDNGVLGVRWREALDGVDDHLQVLGQQSGLDVAAEPFESLETLFGQSQQPGNLDTLLSSPSDVSGDLEALPAGSSGVALFDMFDAPPVPGNMLDDRIRHALQSPLTDFSVGRVPGQRTSGDGRWTDDGHPQVGGQAAAVAQAVLEHFIDLLRVNAPPPINNPVESRPHESESPEKHVDGPLADASQIALEVDNGGAQQSEVQEENPDVVEGASQDLQAQEPMSEVSVLETSNPGPVDCHGDDIDMEENQTGEPLPSEVNGEEPSSVQNPMLTQDAAGQTGETGLNNEDPDTNGIDPTFLEALPEDLRAEVLASQRARPAQSPTNAPEPTSAEEIDPEFLAALPPEIQAEVLAQQRAQRVAQQAAGQPVEMDNASIIATFPAELREEVLLTSSQAVLQALPSSLLAEAQMLRYRAMSNYEARSGLFGSGHRLHNRTSGLDFSRQTGTTRRFAAPLVRMSSVAGKLKDVEGEPLMDSNALKALIRLLRLAQPLGKGLLQRLFLNLSAHSCTRATLVHHLLDMVKPETEGSGGITNVNSQRLYGCQSNVVYGRSQLLDGLPPLVLRRVLEIMNFLATNHSAVANILFYRDPSLVPDYLGPIQVITNDKGKEKIGDLGSSHEGDVPVILLLKLLGRPLVLRSNAHLEQVMGLLQVVVFAAASKLDRQSHSEQGAATSSHILSGNEEVVSGTQEDSPVLERESVHDAKKPNDGVSTSDGQENTKLYDIFLQLPQSDLHNLCSLLGHEGLSDKVYLLVCEVVKKLCSVAALHRKFFILELSDLAHSLSSSAVSELTTLRNTQMLGLNAGSMTGAATLRVLQTLGSLTSSPNNDGEQEEHATLWKLNMSLDPLWEELSNCISPMETKLVSQSALSSNMSSTNGRDHIINGSASPSSPLPVGTQRLLPFIEAFFVLCEKLQGKNPIMQQDHEVKEFSGSLELFIRFTEKHRRLLNAFIRQNPSLLQKSLTMMLKAPRLIDFDNKRAYFRSRIRQQHQRTSRSLRISVRRAYLLEDSYNQLRMRPAQDLRGRLNVHFQGEEGIDAGGLTREWYQSLSRVIFDKGALLFTTGGNNATFQPNPNSVFQTEHLSYFKFVGRLVSKALFDGQLLDVYFTRSFYKHILGVKVTYHDIEAVDPDYYKNLKWMLENDVSEVPDLTFSMDADEEKHILYEKTEVSEYELKPGGGNIRVTEETKHEYVDLVAEHILTNAIRPQINSFLEGFNELIPRELISIFNDKELELLISGLPEIDLDDLKANTEYTGYMAASNVVQWFWEVVKAFNKEDTARFLQFVTGTSKVPLEGFKALQGISGPQKFQVHKAYGAPERLPSAHTCFNQLDLPEYTTKEQLEERLLLAIHEASEGFGFG